MKKEYYDILYKLALKAYKKNEMPVSAILVKNNKIIAKAYNRKNISNNPLYHAEILCLQKGYKKLKRWNLNDCSLYVSLEPCDMCKILIEESRIDQVYFLLNKGKNNNKYTKTKYEQMYANEGEKFKKLIDKFFKKIRK